jgi:hypothetical protein
MSYIYLICEPGYVICTDMNSSCSSMLLDLSVDMVI